MVFTMRRAWLLAALLQHAAAAPVRVVGILKDAAAPDAAQHLYAFLRSASSAAAAMAAVAGQLGALGASGASRLASVVFRLFVPTEFTAVSSAFSASVSAKRERASATAAMRSSSNSRPSACGSCSTSRSAVLGRWSAGSEECMNRRFSPATRARSSYLRASSFTSSAPALRARPQFHAAGAHQLRGRVRRGMREAAGLPAHFEVDRRGDFPPELVPAEEEDHPLSLIHI